MRLQCCVLLLTFCLICRNNFASSGQSGGADSQDDENRIYDFKKLGGSTCAYTASWLAHLNLFRRVTWWVDSTKMEAASFQLYDASKNKFQVSDPDSYYVHHMSSYEHLLHRKVGYDVAKNATIVLSKAAIKGECDNLVISDTREYLALIPFFGGLPPDVTVDMKVKSIGQGNSLMSPDIKALLCMATLCSTLRYYGHAVIGVVRDHDRELMIQILDTMHPSIKAHTQIVQLKMPKPANLPFHLLAWGAEYVKKYNCGLISEKKSKRNLQNGKNDSGKKSKNKNKNNNNKKDENEINKIDSDAHSDNRVKKDENSWYIRRILEEIISPISGIKWNFLPSISMNEKVVRNEEKSVISPELPIESSAVPILPGGILKDESNGGRSGSDGKDDKLKHSTDTPTLPHTLPLPLPQPPSTATATITIQSEHHGKKKHQDRNRSNRENTVDVSNSSHVEDEVVSEVEVEVEDGISESYSIDHPLMAICGAKGIASPRGTTINMTYHRPSIIHDRRYGDTGDSVDTKMKTVKTATFTKDGLTKTEKVVEIVKNEKIEIKKEDKGNYDIKKGKEIVELKEAEKEVVIGNNRKNHPDWSRNRKLKKKNDIVAIQYVYYTECDQIVRYDTPVTLKALSLALNDTTFFSGRRREKSPVTPADDYMGGISQWRECGTPGYSMNYPKDTSVRKNLDRRNLLDKNIENEIN